MYSGLQLHFEDGLCTWQLEISGIPAGALFGFKLLWGYLPVVLLLPTWVILINKMCELVKPGSTLSACEVVLN